MKKMAKGFNSYTPFGKWSELDHRRKYMSGNGDLAEETLRAPERIAGVLVQRIQGGALAVGDTVPTERELCEEFAASRPTVREALSLLQLKGYSEAVSGKRSKITKPSLDDVLMSAAGHIREILGNADSAAHLEQMRQFIEAAAVRYASDFASNIQVARLQAALKDNFDAIGTERFPETDIAFHRAIVDVVGNPVILKLHDLFVSSMLANRPSMSDRNAHDELVYGEHRDIYHAILHGDAQKGNALIDQHLARAYRSRLAAPESVSNNRRHEEGG